MKKLSLSLLVSIFLFSLLPDSLAQTKNKDDSEKVYLSTVINKRKQKNVSTIFDFMAISSNSKKTEEKKIVEIKETEDIEDDIYKNIPEFERREIEKRFTKAKLREDTCLSLSSQKSYDFCMNLLESQHIQKEKNELKEKYDKLKLNDDICHAVKDFDNFKYCSQLLILQEELIAERKAQCVNKKIAGNNIYIDLNAQKIYGVKDCEMIVYSRTITGKNSTPSPVGEFKILFSRTKHWMQGEWYVKKAYYFDRRGYAVHDAGWRYLWEPKHRAVYGSQGCINMPFEAMDIIWENFAIGDNVKIFRSIPDDIQAELDEIALEEDFIDPVEKSE